MVCVNRLYLHFSRGLFGPDVVSLSVAVCVGVYMGGLSLWGLWGLSGGVWGIILIVMVCWFIFSFPSCPISSAPRFIPQCVFCSHLDKRENAELYLVHASQQQTTSAHFKQPHQLVGSIIKERQPATNAQDIANDTIDSHTSP